MNLEQQVCSLDLAKQLKVFGVKQDVGFVWALADTDRSNGEWMIFERRRCWLEGDVAAFTVAELGEMLPSPRNDHEWLRFIKSRLERFTLVESAIRARWRRE